MASAQYQDLIDRVIHFEIDPGPKTFSFEDRLAHENGWTLNFAREVILEYKRFCILAVCAGHPVTPSQAVDQAWHLHLTYTHSYWDRFCQEALGKPLHHGPTAGGLSESLKFQDWYERTLQSYKETFGISPPARIWPSVKERFSGNNQIHWVDRRAHVILSKQFLKQSLLAC